MTYRDPRDARIAKLEAEKVELLEELAASRPRFRCSDCRKTQCFHCRSAERALTFLQAGYQAPRSIEHRAWWWAILSAVFLVLHLVLFLCR